MVRYNLSRKRPTDDDTDHATDLPDPKGATDADVRRAVEAAEGGSA